MSELDKVDHAIKQGRVGLSGENGCFQVLYRYSCPQKRLSTERNEEESASTHEGGSERLFRNRPKQGRRT